MVLDAILERIGGKKSGAGWIGRCPAHHDRHASLSVGQGKDSRVLIHCHAGCSVEAVLAALGLEKRDLYREGEGGGSALPVQRRVVRVAGEPVDRNGGLTLEGLAEAKRLPIELLRGLGCETVHYFGRASVLIPYTDDAGDTVGVRYRLALRGDAKFRWKPGTKASTLLYGAGRLSEAREAGHVVVVEGETDAWTLIHHGVPVVGLPGAGMWNEEHAARLEQIETVFVVAEPDKGGDTLLAKLRLSSISQRVRVVRLPTQDVSDLHISDEAAFRSTFEAALQAAPTLLDAEAQERRELASEAWAACHELAQEHDILGSFTDQLRERGFVGRTDTPKLVFLVLVSRLLARPVSLVLHGLSSAGKSYNVDSVLPFFPKSSYFGRSGMSERALIYSEERFEHRIVYIAEAAAVAAEGLSAYFLRTLISENRLVYETVEKDGDRLVTRVIEKPGPVGVILTTTRLRLDPEIETRALALTVPDDPGLTREIMRAIARRDDEAAAQEPPKEWLALQTWLELAGERRVTDEDGFLLTLAERIPVIAVRMRRDFALVRSLVFAHAIVHQASRRRDQHARIVATLEDYAVVRELVEGILAEGIGATVSSDVRETVTALRAAIKKAAPDTSARRAQVQAELRLDDRAARRRLAQATAGGFIVNTNPGRGKTALYTIGDPLPDTLDVLPDLANLDPDNPAPSATATAPSPSPPICGHNETWLARDGNTRCCVCDPPAFAREVVEVEQQIGNELTVSD